MIQQSEILLSANNTEKENNNCITRYEIIFYEKKLISSVIGRFNQKQ